MTENYNTFAKQRSWDKLFLFMIWTTIIKWSKLQSTSCCSSTVWFRCNDESDWNCISYQYINMFDQYHSCPHYEQQNWLFQPTVQFFWLNPDRWQQVRVTFGHIWSSCRLWASLEKQYLTFLTKTLWCWPEMADDVFEVPPRLSTLWTVFINH